MKIIILGAGGQIGSAIYHGLRNRYHVIGTSRKDSQGYLKFDPFKDAWSTLGKVDVLINAVGQIEASATSSFHHIHVGLTELILKNRDFIGRPRIIQISALGASPRHKVEFLRTKGIADDLLLAHPGTTVLRPSIVCTPRTMIVKKMLMLARIARYSLGFLVVPKNFLTTTIQPVMPQDVVDTIKAVCAGSREAVINVVGTDKISFGDMISMMAATMQRKIRLIEVPKKLTDRLVHHVIAPLFPQVINTQQYQLLFEDNIDESMALERILNRIPQSTRQFFIHEFNYAHH